MANVASRVRVCPSGIEAAARPFVWAAGLERVPFTKQTQRLSRKQFMDILQLVIWVVTAGGLIGLALAFFKSERIGVRIGALGAFAVFYFAMLLWGPVDATWGNLAIGGVVVIALMSRMRKPDADKAHAERPSDD